jgi:iron complex transport system substrate-binding protein
MRIVSLLPSLTELVCALGRGGDLVGVTHECDFPPGVERLPHLTESVIPAGASSAEIDALVAGQGGSLYRLDAGRLAELRPDWILTQAQCDVCAVNEGTVREVAAALPSRPRVESVNPTDLAGVFTMFETIGALLDARGAAEDLVSAFVMQIATLNRETHGLSRPRVVLLEWLDPPFTSGHWNPDLVAIAGGDERLARSGQPSRRVTWDKFASASPEVLLVAPCGFDLHRAEAETDRLADHPAWRDLPAVRNGRVVLADGSAYFSRPGPRLLDSLRIAAAAIHPERFADLAPSGGWRRLTVSS